MDHFSGGVTSLEGLDYLCLELCNLFPHFNLSNFTIPRLREILRKNHVFISHSARKWEIIKRLQDYIEQNKPIIGRSLEVIVLETLREKFGSPKEPTPRVKTEPRDNSLFSNDNPFQRQVKTEPRDNSFFSNNNPFQRQVKTESRDNNIFSNDNPFQSQQMSSQNHNARRKQKWSPPISVSLQGNQLPKANSNSKHSKVRHQQKETKAIKGVSSFLIIFGLSLIIGFWWRKEKIEIGFCGLGKPTWSLADTKVPDRANVLGLRCEPCPAHASCSPNFEAHCKDDFILKPHPLSLGGLIPLPPTCEPDNDKLRRVKTVADKAIKVLRDQRTKWECANSREAIKSPEIREPDLKSEVGKKRHKGMSPAEFDDLWELALRDILGNDEIVSQTQKPSDVLTLTSISVSHLPFTCAAHRFFQLHLLRISFTIIAVCLLLCARSHVLARRSNEALSLELAATTLDRLATQAALSARGYSCKPYIPICQLRDDLLRFEPNIRRRNKLWKLVSGVIEDNANIQKFIREGPHGNVYPMWQWIGAIGNISEPKGSAGRGPVSNIFLGPKGLPRRHERPFIDM